ncbi:hypothetical protein JCM10212_005869 [Sporobolomyces blumeae]
MVSTDQVNGPKAALIGGAIGGVVSGLVLVSILFWLVHRLGLHPGRSPPRRQSNGIYDDDDDFHADSRSRAVTPASSSRPVSVFSDTTVDSTEGRDRNDKTRPRRKLTRRASEGTSVRSLRTMRDKLGGWTSEQGKKGVNVNEQDHATWPLDLDDDLTTTTSFVSEHPDPRAGSYPNPDSTVIALPLPPPSVAPFANSFPPVHYLSRPSFVVPPQQRHEPQPVQPLRFAPVEIRGGGGYAGAIARAAAASYPPDGTTVPSGAACARSNGQKGRRVAAEAYE